MTIDLMVLPLRRKLLYPNGIRLPSVCRCCAVVRYNVAQPVSGKERKDKLTRRQLLAQAAVRRESINERWTHNPTGRLQARYNRDG